MVLLPAVYAGLTLLAAWGVYWHATENTWIMSPTVGPTGIFHILAYAAPIPGTLSLQAQRVLSRSIDGLHPRQPAQNRIDLRIQHRRQIIGHDYRVEAQPCCPPFR